MLIELNLVFVTLVLTERKVKSFSVLKLFITTNKQELGNRFYSFTAKTRVDSFMNFFPCLFFFLQF